MKTNGKMKKYLALMIIALVAATLFPLPCRAAGKIDLNRDACLHIIYQNEDTLLPGAEFVAYRVADTDANAHMKVTKDFSRYPLNFNVLDQSEWAEMAETLKGYVQRDNLKKYASQVTDDNGQADMTLKPGLYLVFADPLMTPSRVYFSEPFMAFLPAPDPKANDWAYETTARPKNSTRSTARKVLKIWDDAGYETLRPKEVTVDLLCNGEVSDSVVLNAENNWRYDWGELNPMYEWLVTEREVEGYTAVVNQEGTTFTITNTYVVLPPPPSNEITVQKKITGDTAPSSVTFTFLLTPNAKDIPMPEGAKDNKATAFVKGAGTASFGKINFTKAGVYSYTVKEEDGVEVGWTYDSTVYTVTFTVTEAENGTLTVKQDIKANNAAKNVIEFTNSYKTPGEKIPQTGLLWWPVPVLLLAGLVLILLGCVLRKER